MRFILVNPQAWHIETAFVDHAVVKFMRGPTSRIGFGVGSSDLGVKKLSWEKFSGSKVSLRSHFSVSISSGNRGSVVAI